ncbi:MAG: zinc-binding dehydrogenase [Pseudomonadota bacterium]
MRMRAAVLRETGKPFPFADSSPLCIEQVELDPPGKGEVLIAIRAVGLCHSDLVAITGERARPTPIVIGHEAAGVIVELGPEVSGCEVGDHVVPSYVSSCGHCEMCREGRPALCIPATKANVAGTMLDGTTRLHKDGKRINHHSGIAGFAEFAVVSQNALVKIDKSMPFEHAALFGCGVVTGVGSVVNTGCVRAGQSVAVVGLGGVGLSALLAARASGASKVIAVDINADKLAKAKEMGADEGFNPAEGGAIEALRNATGGGVDLAVETAGSPRALETAYTITRRGGTTVGAGMPGPEASMPLSHLSLVGEERTLKGSYMGGCVPSRDIPRYMDLFRRGLLPVDKLMSRTIGLDDLNAAFDRLHHGATIREVLVP